MQTLDRRTFLALAAGAAGAMWLPRALARPSRSGLESFFTWTKFRDGVHAANDLSMGGNVLVVASSGQTLLVDTKFPAFARALAREAETLGGKLTLVINTHHHADHTAGNALLHDQAGLIAHEKAAERIAGQLERYVGAARGGPGQVDQDRPGADKVLEDAQAAAEAAPTWTAEQFVPDQKIAAWPHSLKFGDADVTLHHFGAGHTDNDVVVQLPQANVLHVGDLCFHGLHPFFDPGGGATCRGWSESVAKAIALCDDETLVVPGHGANTDRAGLEAQKRYLDELWDRVAKEISAGKTKEEVSAMTWDFMDGLGFEQVRSRAIGAVYDEASRGG